MAASKKVSKKKVKKAAKKTVKKSAKKPVKKVMKKIAKKAVKKTAKKSVKKTAKKVVKKIAKKAVKKTAKKIVKKVAKKPVQKAPQGPVSTVFTPTPIPAAQKPIVQAVSPSNEMAEIVEIGTNSFVIVVNRARNFFERSEMRILLGICQAAGSEDDGATRLYYWLKEHRRDVLNDSSITTIFDKALKLIYRSLINTYSVKE